jgi:hypothetical protein
MRDAAEDGGDPAVRPADRVLDLRERAGPVRSSSQLVEQLAHQVAAAVVEEGDLVGFGHGIPRRVLHLHAS